MSNFNQTRTPSNTELIASGLALVPIPFGQKRPATPGWNLPHKVIKHLEDAVRLEGMNVGLAHAYCDPSPTCALDVDHFPTADDWLSTHGIDLRELLFAHDSVVIQSGKRHSLKVLYRLPVGAKALETKQITGHDGGMAIEFRCATREGKTVQDVLPPSLHPEGTHYQWLGNGSPLFLPTIPDPLLDLWLGMIGNTLRVSKRRDLALVGVHQRQESPREVACLESALSFIDADCDYPTWRNIVWAILSTGWTCAEGIALRWSMSAPHRFDADKFWMVVNSYMPNRTNPITQGTVIHHARLGGWND